MVQSQRRNRLRLFKVVCQDSPIRRFLVNNSIRRKEIVEVAVELVSPVKDILDLPS